MHRAVPPAWHGLGEQLSSLETTNKQVELHYVLALIQSLFEHATLSKRFGTVERCTMYSKSSDHRFY